MTDLGSAVFSVRTMGAGPLKVRAVIWDPLTVGIGSDDAPNGAAGCRRSACTYVPTFPSRVGTFDQSGPRIVGLGHTTTRRGNLSGQDAMTVKSKRIPRSGGLRPRHVVVVDRPVSRRETEQRLGGSSSAATGPSPRDGCEREASWESANVATFQPSSDSTGPKMPPRGAANAFAPNAPSSWVWASSPKSALVVRGKGGVLQMSIEAGLLARRRSPASFAPQAS